jgi:hypothetical protein
MLIFKLPDGIAGVKNTIAGVIKSPKSDSRTA